MTLLLAATTWRNWTPAHSWRFTMAGSLERGAMYSCPQAWVKRERDGSYVVTPNDYTGTGPWPFADAKSAVSFCAHYAPLEQWQFTPTDIDGKPSHRTPRQHAASPPVRVVRVERPQPKQLTGGNR